MPYSVPAVGRPGHRRSASNIVAPPTMSMAAPTTVTAATEMAGPGPGAFASLGVLPTRRRPSGRATFQVGSRDDDDDSPDESPEDSSAPKNNRDDDDRGHLRLPPLRLRTKLLSSFDDQPIPFPRSSPLPSPTHTESRKDRPLSPLATTMVTPPTPLADPPTRTTPSPPVSRTSSTSGLLSNGKPLKSSLKSSNSSPNIPFPPQSMVPSIMFPQHHRAASAPTTPHIQPPAAFSPCASPCPSSAATSPGPSQKNVHFASQEEGGLATVRVYKRSAKPASLLRIGDETETETEGESSSAPNGFFASVWNTGRASAYPFPKISPATVGCSFPKPVNTSEAPDELTFEIDMKKSTPVPARGAERAEGNIYFESLGFLAQAASDKPTHPLCLTGTLLVRNISYHKVVSVRYTLDDWNTTNDVLARHEKSLAALPERFLLASLPLIEDAASYADPSTQRKREVVCKPRGFEDITLLQNGSAPAWDRFRFELSLEKYESTLDQRSLLFVGRYSTSGAGAPSDNNNIGGGVPRELEWWDNNFGANYRIGFAKKMIKDDRLKEEERKRKEGIYGGVHLNAYRRNVAHSAPPQFAPSKPYPAPPQITSSQSFPPDRLGASSQAQRDRQAQAHQAALEQRLRRLNLRNYAAPSAAAAAAHPAVAVRSPLGLIDTKGEEDNEKEHEDADDRPSLTLHHPESSTTTTSADSTPLLTPTQEREDEIAALLKGPTSTTHDLDVNILGHADDDDGEDRWSGGLRRPMEIGKGRRISPLDELLSSSSQTPTPTQPATSDLVGFDVHQMGTSPPFSLLAGLENRFGSLSSSNMGGTTTSRRQNPPSAPPVQTLDHEGEGLQQSNLNSSSVQPLMPPQWRRHSHGQPPQSVPPSFSIGRTSPPGSRSGSGTGSGSGSVSGGGSGSDSTRTKGPSAPYPQWKIQSPQPWPLLPPHRRGVMSPPPPPPPPSTATVLPQISSSPLQLTDDQVRSPSPSVAFRQLLPQRRSPPTDHQQRQQAPPPSPPDDALYHAFVRQWCFASGPGPTVNGSVGNGNNNGKGIESGVPVR